jgi:hypothetical protein
LWWWALVYSKEKKVLALYQGVKFSVCHCLVEGLKAGSAMGEIIMRFNYNAPRLNENLGAAFNDFSFRAFNVELDQQGAAIRDRRDELVNP